jgi:hypothetical protein
MALAILTAPQYARIWINCTGFTGGIAQPPTAVGGVPAASKFCAINAKALNQSLATGTAVVPDCADVTKVSVIKRTPLSKDWAITGSGYIELSMRKDLQDIADHAVSIPIVFEILDDQIPPVNAGWYSGKAFMETFNFVANNTDAYMTVDVNFTADGALTWTNAP